MRISRLGLVVALATIVALPLSLDANEAQTAAGAADGSAAALRRGRIMFLQCRACHSTEVDGEHKVGPNLHGVIGATAGRKADFTYSDAMKDSGIVWNAETLDAFLTKPTDYVPGTIMVFVGMEKPDDRQALIAYIRSQTE